MDLKIKGKTAIVTGGSSGIGLSCAKALFQQGVQVIIAAHQGYIVSFFLFFCLLLSQQETGPQVSGKIICIQKNYKQTT